jgi:hypothetical protein
MWWMPIELLKHVVAEIPFAERFVSTVKSCMLNNFMLNFYLHVDTKLTETNIGKKLKNLYTDWLVITV